MNSVIHVHIYRHKCIFQVCFIHFNFVESTNSERALYNTMIMVQCKKYIDIVKKLIKNYTSKKIRASNSLFVFY